MRFLLLFLIFINSFVFAAPVEVSVDRNPAYLNESFDIIFTATESPDNNPDFSPLEKDFEIINQSHNSSMSWVNGKSSTQIQWVFTVMAKQTGKQTIPAIKFGNHSSPELVVTINDRQSDKTPQKKALLFLDVEASPEKPYLQSQVIYTLRFFRRVNIAEASLKELELNDAVVEKLGDDKNYKTQRNGVTYAVTERKYAVFPQKSGLMTIEPLELTAEVLDYNSPNFGGFFGSSNTHRERINSKTITLDVKPIPADFVGKHWLAANEVKIAEKWSGDISQMKVGEPLTRTITLMANGATVGQLPELQASSTQTDLKNYPDQPLLKEKKTDEGVIAFREEKIAFIPSKAGTYTLPEISINWFNTRTEKMETVSIPQTIVTAIGGTNTETNSTQQEPLENKSVAEPITENTPLSNSQSPKNNILWQGLSAFFALAWLLTLWMYFNKKPASISKQENTQAEIKLKDSMLALKKACKVNDADAAKQALLNWGRFKYACNSLGALANYCNDDLQLQIQLLNQQLYSSKNLEWQGEKLYQAFKNHSAADKALKTTENSELEPLYRI